MKTFSILITALFTLAIPAQAQVSEYRSGTTVVMLYENRHLLFSSENEWITVGCGASRDLQRSITEARNQGQWDLEVARSLIMKDLFSIAVFPDTKIWQIQIPKDVEVNMTPEFKIPARIAAQNTWSDNGVYHTCVAMAMFKK